jgi:hypothetical protein
VCSLVCRHRPLPRSSFSCLSSATRGATPSPAAPESLVLHPSPHRPVSPSSSSTPESHRRGPKSSPPDPNATAGRRDPRTRCQVVAPPRRLLTEARRHRSLCPPDGCSPRPDSRSLRPNSRASANVFPSLIPSESLIPFQSL